MKVLTLALSVFWVWGVAQAQEPTALWRQALDLWEADRPGAQALAQQAAVGFEAWASPSGWYNASLAWELAGQAPRSLLTLRRALVQEPWDGTLGEAWQRKAPDQPGSGGPLVGTLSFWLLVLGWNLLVLGGLLVLGKKLRPRWLVVPLTVALLGLAGWGSAALLPPEAVVLQSTAVHQGDHAVFQQVGSLDAGALVTVLSRQNGWMQVSSSSGLKGWVPQDRVEFVILPGSPSPADELQK